METVINHRE